MQKKREFRKTIWTAVAIAICTIGIATFAIISLWEIQVVLEEKAVSLAEIAVYTSENLRNMIDEKQENRKMKYYINKFLEASNEKCVEAMLTEKYEVADICLQEANIYLTMCTKLLYEYGKEDAELVNEYLQVVELYHEVYIYVTMVKVQAD